MVEIEVVEMFVYDDFEFIQYVYCHRDKLVKPENWLQDRLYFYNNFNGTYGKLTKICGNYNKIEK